MNLKTLIFIFFSLVLIATLATGQTTPYNKLDKLKVNDLIAGKLEVQSTSKSSLPCPSMTQVQRDAIVSPQDGSCVYNNDANVLNIYNGTEWVEVGSGGGAGGGINNWETANFYEVGDVVIESNKIYQCNTQHTSSVFATDIANWTKLVAPISLTTEVSGVLPMANGGTDKALTPELGGIVYTDGGSMEILGAGTLGQLLKSNGAAAPEWTTLSVDDATFSGVLSLGKGGTNKSLTASNGAIAYSDTDSLELLAPGTAGQVLQSNGVGAPSYVNKSISGKNESGSSVTLEEIQVSNNQLTQTDVNKHLLESGNSNILANPSFEHSTVSTSWTSLAGTLAEDLSVVVNGKKSLSVNLSTQALALTQDSTLYAAQFADGVQGLASIRVKTSLSGIKVCSRQAGVTSTTNCVNVQGNGKWGLYKIPMILGATSNGISIASNGTSLTGTVYLDDAFVGAVDLQATVDASKIAGEAFIPGSTNCQWNRTSTTVGAFTADADCVGPTISYSSMGSWQTNDTDLPRFTVNNLPSGVYKAKIIGSTYQGTGGTPVYAINDGATTCEPSNANSNTTNSTTFIAECVFSYNSSGNRTFEVFAGSTSNTVQLFNGTTTPRGSLKFILEYYGSSSVYSSTNADTDWASCQFSTLAWQGLGTVTNNLMCKRDGSDLLMRGTFVVGSTVASQAQIPMPVWNGVQLNTKALTAVSDYGRLIRNLAGASQNKDYIALGPTSSLAYATIGIIEYSSTAAPLTSQNGNALFSVGESISTELRIPIESWQNSNIIIGQFNGLESCTNTLECTDTFSAKISSAGVVSDENVNWINGNCTNSAGLGTCTFNTSIFSVTPNCSITYDGAGNTFAGRTASVRSASSTQILYITEAGSVVAAPVNIICQKQGVDYTGKTAKAVSSDQSLRTPGITKGVVHSCRVNNNGTASIDTASGTCASFVSSVSRSTAGAVTVNFLSSAFAYNPICTISNAQSGAYRICQFDSAITTTSAATVCANGATTPTDTAFNLICHGISP